VLIAGSLDRAVVDLLRAGAADFVSKHELERLPSVVDTALANAHRCAGSRGDSGRSFDCSPAA
jgi:hypothetical protein